MADYFFIHYEMINYDVTNYTVIHFHADIEDDIIVFLLEI